MTKTNFEIENYKDIKNYIHNYLGLTKEEVREMALEVVKNTVKKEVDKCLNDENRLQHMIEKEILSQIKYGQDGYKRRSFLISVMDEVYNRIDEIIHEEVLKRLQRKLSRQESSSNNYYKTKTARLYSKIKNSRKHNIINIVNKIVKEHDIIVSEN